jgi:hypothetical protein
VMIGTNFPSPKVVTVSTAVDVTSTTVGGVLLFCYGASVNCYVGMLMIAMKQQQLIHS